MGSNASGEHMELVRVSGAVLLDLRGLIDPSKFAMPTPGQRKALQWLQNSMTALAAMAEAADVLSEEPTQINVIDENGQIIAL